MPYVHQGRDPAVGIDCLGVPVVIAKRLGIPHEDTKDYDINPNPRTLLLELSRSMERIGAPRDGSVCVFWTKHQLEAQHLGICVPGGFIHCRSRMTGSGAPGGAVIYQRWTAWWTEHVHSYWWYRGCVIPRHKQWR